MSWANSFLKQIGTGDEVKGWDHANRIFVGGGSYRLSPKYAFTAYCRITLNPSISQNYVFAPDRQNDIGALVKTFDLPKYQIDNKVLNAYNRPNIVQTKLKYDPINIVFHDDSADTTRELWYNYYSYYYRDSDYEEGVYRMAGSKYGIRPSQNWGYNPANPWESDQHLISKIELFSFHQKKFSSYVLYNPIITNWRHGQHNYSEGTGVMENSMTVAYESVKYEKGWVTENQFQDFLLHYDRSPSPLTPAGGGTQSILGPGGLLNAADEIAGDLASGNPIGAAFKALRAAQNFKGADLAKIAGAEAIGVVKDVLRGNNPLSGVNFPSLGGLASSLGGEVSGALGKLSGGGLSSIGGAFSSLQTGSLAKLSLTSAAGIAGTTQNILGSAQKLSGAVSSNGGSLGQLASGAFAPNSNLNVKFPSNTGGIDRFVNSLGDPNAPQYTGDDPIVRARLGLPPLEA
jgi:hypothetical protein